LSIGLESKGELVAICILPMLPGTSVVERGHKFEGNPKKVNIDKLMI
jgi:hypothetical protein